MGRGGGGENNAGVHECRWISGLSVMRESTAQSTAQVRVARMGQGGGLMGEWRRGDMEGQW